ncbi:MAG: hypothetical protein JWN57_1747 [Frankiales bacterium]|jgi:hypothetical protein|nr:hypothetical protein [Frankiales bacterium]
MTDAAFPAREWLQDMQNDVHVCVEETRRLVALSRALLDSLPASAGWPSGAGSQDTARTG